MENRKTISIIGGTGQMGSIFALAFKEKGHNVLIAGRNTTISLEEAAKQGDIVIITVPIKVTLEVIKKIAPLIKKDSILIDFTSVKKKPCEIMKKYSNCNVIGGHPLFGPKVKIPDQTFVLCPVKGNKTWELKRILESIKLKVVIMTPEEHDKEMAIIQCMNQFSNIGFAKSLLENEFDLKKSDMFTPNFKLHLSVLGRTLSQNPELYPEILIENPYSQETIKSFIKNLQNLNKMIKMGKEEKLEKEIIKLKEYFSTITEESREITSKALELMKKNDK